MTVSLPPPPELVLCATHRLARTMRLEGVAGADAPSAAVRLPKTATIAQWLGEFAEEALLCGEIDAAEAPLRVLGAQQEQLLWEATIRRALGEGDAAALFDVAGLAAEARAANALIDTWQLDVDASHARVARDLSRPLCEPPVGDAIGQSRVAGGFDCARRRAIAGRDRACGF